LVDSLISPLKIVVWKLSLNIENEAKESLLTALVPMYLIFFATYNDFI
jgi:hypothetical protein